MIDPIQVLEALKKEKYKVWYSKSPRDEKLDKITYALKESKLVILGVSDQFARDEKCVHVFELVKNILKKSYLIVEFGPDGSHKWMEDRVFASVCSDYRIIMQDKKRYGHKLSDVLESVEKQLGKQENDKRGDEADSEADVDVFISYCWKNSHEAVKKVSFSMYLIIMSFFS